MRVKKYCCDASKLAYENYYSNQAGSGMPIFVGSKNQRGHGFGSLLSGLFKTVAPILKSGLSKLGKHAASTGISIAGDVLRGQDIKDSAKNRALEGIKNLGRDVGLISQSDDETRQGRQQSQFPDNSRNQKTVKRKQYTSRTGSSIHKKKKSRKVGDIFD